MLQVPESHKKGITCIAAIMVSDRAAMFATTSSDGTAHVYEIVLPASTGGDSYFLYSYMSGNHSL